MKTRSKIQLWISFLLITGMMIRTGVLSAQTYQSVFAQSTLVVEGTSNLHDWDVKADNFNAKAEIVKKDGQPQINNFQLTVKSESLKSGRSGMDKNTFTALKTDKHKSISFTYTGTQSMTPAGGNNYNVTITGNLFIAGVTKPVQIKGKMTDNGNGYTIDGSHKIDMSVYGVTPPTALMGSIKTGKDLQINYHLVLK